MKRLLMLVLIGVIVTGLSAQIAASFRNQSTGGVLDDELDMMFNGVDLAYIKGAHIYTNLSNFEGSDRLFLNQDSNHYLFGMSSAYPWDPALRFALIYKYWDNKTPLSYSYNTGNHTINGMGDFDQIWQNYDDTDGDGLYDRLRMDTVKLSSYNTQSGETFGFNNTWKSKKHIIGLLIGWNTSETTYSYSNGLLEDLQNPSGTPSYDVRNVIQYFDDNEPGVIIDSVGMHTSGDFGRIHKDKTVFGKLGIAFISGPQELLIEPSFNVIDNRDNRKDIAKSESSASAITSYENCIVTDTDKGVEGKLAISYRIYMDKARNPKTSANMQIGIYGGLSGMDSKASTTRYYWQDQIDISSEVMTSSIEETNSDITDGSTAGTTWGAKMKIQGNLGKNAYWGMGWNYGVTDEIFDFSYTSRYRRFSEDIYVSHITSTSKLTGNGTTETLVKTLVIPTGLEYWFTTNKRWAFRCGSIFTQTETHRQEKRTPLSSEPYTTVTEDIDGNVVVDISENEYESYVNNLKTKTSSSVLKYGFGFKANDNLQIDLMGLFDTANVDVINTTFFQNLRLSFSYHF